MTKPRAEIIRPDRRIAAQVETLAYIFDVGISTIQRAIAEHGIVGSSKFGPTLYRVDDVENALFSVDAMKPPPSPSPGSQAGTVGKRRYAPESHRGC